jgi:hypothetical protein
MNWEQPLAILPSLAEFKEDNLLHVDVEGIGSDLVSPGLRGYV